MAFKVEYHKLSKMKDGTIGIYNDDFEELIK